MKTIAVMTLIFLPATFACVSQVLFISSSDLIASVPVIFQYDILRLADDKQSNRVQVSLGLLCSRNTDHCCGTCSMGAPHQEEQTREFGLGRCISDAETQNDGTCP
jgi:hypothetical protein